MVRVGNGKERKRKVRKCQESKRQGIKRKGRTRKGSKSIVFPDTEEHLSSLIAQNPTLANVDLGFHKMGSKVKEKRQFLSSVQIFMTKKTFLATPRGDLLVSYKV